MSTGEHTLDLAVVGNSEISALIDDSASIVWCCLPRMDADPVFCTLLDPDVSESAQGHFSIEIADRVETAQSYLRNTAILETILTDARGNRLRIVDFCPRFRARDRIFRPMMLVRIIEPLAGRPVATVRLRPRFDHGATAPQVTRGSHNLAFRGGSADFRLTTNASLTAIAEELPFVVDAPLAFVLGPDQTLEEPPLALAQGFLEETRYYWEDWVRGLAIPFEWQDAVIRAAISLKLCTYEDTGAVLAALTTSVPESPGSGRNWDYRYCWLRDAAFVVRTLNQLGATKSMEDFLGYIYTLASGTEQMQPVYGIHFERALTEQVEQNLAGYRGHGPVRSGNEAYLQKQHDVYGSVVMASTHLFFDQRLTTPGDASAFEQLERAGDLAYELFDQPDAGLWEFRGRQGVHTYSSVMCWVAADRLTKIALRLGEREKAAHWRSRADLMRDRIIHEAYDEERGAFMETWGGSRLDASTLALTDLGFIAADDDRFLGTLDAVEKHLKRGDYLFRYVDADDFGEPLTSFNLCTFWYLDALARVGRTDEARRLFEHILSRRNHLGLMSEDLHPETGELWGNFPQTYSMLGIIQIAMRLSRPWEHAS